MNITPANLGWWIAGFLIAGTVIGWIQDWLADRWEITCGRPRVVRRWYGTHARVCLRSAAGGDDAARFAVLEWCDEDTAVPWLKVHRLDLDDARYWDEDAEAFWGPVTDFAPHSVRRLRPQVIRFGRVPVPWLTRYLPVRQPGCLDGAR